MCAAVGNFDTGSEKRKPQMGFWVLCATEGVLQSGREMQRKGCDRERDKKVKDVKMIIASEGVLQWAREM